jgi:hypothetical protein
VNASVYSISSVVRKTIVSSGKTSSRSGVCQSCVLSEASVTSSKAVNSKTMLAVHSAGTSAMAWEDDG